MTALLIERCNEYQTSFIDYICSVKETNISLADAEVKAIREALVVRSMEEVKERFAPQVSVTLNEENIIIPLCHKAGFFQTVISLWENIKQGKYTDITLEDFEESLLAKDGCLEEEFVKVQEQIFFYLQKNQYGEAKVQVEKCMTSFDDSLFLLKRLLKQGEKFFQEQEKKHRRFVVETKKEMSLQCVAVSEAFLKSSYHTTKLEDNYQQLLEEVFLNMQTEENAQKSYQRMLLYWNLLLACLPYYYREWLKRNNGGELFAVPAGINIAGILGKQEREMGEIYVEDNFDIKKRVPGMPDFLFILADNCLGDVIGFDLMQTNNMDGVVVYWNHETGEITEQWDSLAEWLDSVMESEKMLINYDGSERNLFD